MEPKYKIAPKNVKNLDISQNQFLRDLDNLKILTLGNETAQCFLKSSTKEEKKTEFDI